MLNIQWLKIGFILLQRFTFDNHHCYKAVAHSIRDRLIETYNDTNSYIH